MNLVTVRDIYRRREEYLGKEISIGGWVRSVRDSKSFGFIVVSDGTFSRPYRWFTTMILQTSMRSAT